MSSQKLSELLLMVKRNQNQPEPAEARVVWRESAAATARGRRGDGRGDRGGGGESGTPTVPSAPPAPAQTGAERRRGHGRRGADAYPGAERVVCRHETLAAVQRCPACGRGTLYRLPIDFVFSGQK